MDHVIEIYFHVPAASKLQCLVMLQKMIGGEGEEDEVEVDQEVVKTFKINVHTATFCNEDLVIRSEDFPEVRPGDVLEIHHQEETFSRLLLQVNSLEILTSDLF